jgi:hypothetical protein
VKRKKRKKNRQKHKRGGVHGRRVISPEEKRSFGLYFWGRGRKGMFRKKYLAWKGIDIG